MVKLKSISNDTTPLNVCKTPISYKSRNKWRKLLHHNGCFSVHSFSIYQLSQLTVAPEFWYNDVVRSAQQRHTDIWEPLLLSAVTVRNLRKIKWSCSFYQVSTLFIHSCLHNCNRVVLQAFSSDCNVTIVLSMNEVSLITL